MTKIILILSFLLLLPSVSSSATIDRYSDITMIALCGTSEKQTESIETGQFAPVVNYKLSTGQNNYLLFPSELEDLSSFRSERFYRVFAYITKNKKNENLLEVLLLVEVEDCSK